MSEGLIPDTGATEADIAIEMVTMMKITDLYEKYTIDLVAKKLDDQIARLYFNRGVTTATRQGSQRSIKMSVKALKSFTKSLAKMINKKITKMITRMITRQVSKQVVKTATKTAGKVASKVATQTVAKGAVATAGGPVSMAVFVLTLGFDILMAVWDIMDEHGFSIVFDQPMIDGIAENINLTFDAEYSSILGGDEGFLNEEVNFETLMLLLSFDEDVSFSVNNEWADFYEGHIHHYMTKIKGHPENWEDYIDTVNLEYTDEYFDLNEMLDTDEEKKDKKVILIAVILIIFVIILLLILIK